MQSSLVLTGKIILPFGPPVMVSHSFCIYLLPGFLIREYFLPLYGYSVSAFTHMTDGETTQRGLRCYSIHLHRVNGETDLACA